MNTSATKLVGLCSLLLVLASCKPKEESPAPQAVANPPSAAPAPEAQSTPTAKVETSTPAPAEKILSPTEAGDYLGKNATVRGKVFGVHVTKKGDVFINVGAPYPNAPFTAVCFQGAIPTEELQALNGLTVSFTGKIKEHNGQVEIILEASDQISK